MHEQNGIIEHRSTLFYMFDVRLHILLIFYFAVIHTLFTDFLLFQLNQKRNVICSSSSCNQIERPYQCYYDSGQSVCASHHRANTIRIFRESMREETKATDSIYIIIIIIIHQSHKLYYGCAIATAATMSVM